MNVVWRLPTAELEDAFVKEAEAQKMIGLKGHRSVGGIRASLYNAVELSWVETLASFMKDFAKKKAETRGPRRARRREEQKKGAEGAFFPRCAFVIFLGPLRTHRGPRCHARARPRRREAERPLRRTSWRPSRGTSSAAR